MSHISEGRSPRQAQETHEWQFTGLWVPPVVMHSLRDGRIEAEEFAILLLIEAYSATDGSGCTVKMKVIGRDLQMDTALVEIFVRRLKSIGLLIIDWPQRHRRIRTCWGLEPVRFPRADHQPAGRNGRGH